MTRKYLGNITDDETMKVSFAEYTSSKCGGAKIILAKIGAITLFLALLGLGAYLFLSVVKLPVAMVPLALFCGVVLWFLWGLTSVEYDYTIYKGKLTVAKLYGGKFLRIERVLTVSEASKIEKVSDAKELPDDVLCCFADYRSKNLVMIMDGDGKRLVIDAPEKTIKALKYYNSKAFLF